MRLARASYRLLCCCLRLGDGSGGTAVNPTGDTVAGLPLLLARCFVVCGVDAHPTSLLTCRGVSTIEGVACRILFASSANTTKIMTGREFTFLAEGR